MEVPQGRHNKVIVCIYEALGTGLLIFAINMSGPGSPSAKFGICFTVFSLILIAGPISGAHFNPAVTLGVYISNVHWKSDWGFCLLIMLAEFFGGIWGMCLAWLCLFNEKGVDVTRAQVPQSELVLLQPGEGISVWDAF